MYEQVEEKRLLLLFVLMTTLSSIEAQRVVYFPFDENNGSSSAIEQVDSTEFPVQNNFQSPERIAGVSGTALRFDGWSTWIEHENFQIPEISTALSIEAWYATESFTAANAGIISQEDNASGFTIEVEPYGKVVFIFWADNTRYVLVSDSTLLKYQWNHIVATVDLVSQVSRIYVNGTVWKELALDNHVAITLAPGKLYIGRDTDLQEFAGFPLTMANGALDELSIYQNVLPAEEIHQRYLDHSSVIPDLHVDAEIRHEGDHLRPRFHAMPNTSWANECYGLTFYNGKYHLFFQKNPNGPYLYFMHWGHLTSPDLVSWTEEKIALAPSPGFDSFGVWSGTTIKNHDGKPVIFYTGVNGVKAGIGLAESVDEDLIHWEEAASNPVIAEAPPEVKHRDFRDPYVWKAGDAYYMIVGSGLQFGGGGYLFTFKSPDLRNWTKIPPLYNDTDVSRSGDFWEMPFFYQLNDDTWMLSVTPLPVNGVRAKAVYWLGSFINEKFVPFDPVPKSLELISDNLLAPAIGKDENERIVYTGIIPEDRNVEDQVKAGWRHLFSLPRALRLLKDSTIGQIPHPNLCRLRDEFVGISDRLIGTGSEFNFPEFSGNQMELDFEIDADSATKFSIHVLKNSDKSEFTAIHFDLQENKITLDRFHSSLSATGKDTRTTNYVFDHRENIKVNIFIDHSVLEVFIDNIVVFSTRVYPSKIESSKVDVITEQGSVNVVTVNSWQMNDMKEPLSVEVCEPDAAELPDQLRKQEIKAGPITALDQTEGNIVEVYPNPATEKLSIRFTGKTRDIKVYSSSGVLLKQIQLFESGELSLETLQPGVYFFKVDGAYKSQIFKLVIE